MWAMTLWDHPSPHLQWGVVILTSLAGAGYDLATYRIPNRITGPVFVVGLFSAVWIGGLPAFADAVCGCLLLALPYILLFLFVGGGAGDAKMMGALGAWLGIVNGVVVLVSVVVAGAVCGLCFALAKRQFQAVLGRVAGMLMGIVIHPVIQGKAGTSDNRPAAQREMLAMPYGAAIFIGVCIAGIGVFLWNS